MDSNIRCAALELNALTSTPCGLLVDGTHCVYHMMCFAVSGEWHVTINTNTTKTLGLLAVDADVICH